MNPMKFKYKQSRPFSSLFCIGLSIWLFYIVVIPFIYLDKAYFLSLLVSPILIIILWVSYYHLKTYFKLRGVDRFIILNDKSIVFPELGDSLKIIEVYYNQITDIYYGTGRHNAVISLIIKYDTVGHAYIDNTQLRYEDFESICDILKTKLSKQKILIK
jgi:hypothetical protein